MTSRHDGKIGVNVSGDYIKKDTNHISQQFIAACMRKDGYGQEEAFENYKKILNRENKELDNGTGN